MNTQGCITNIQKYSVHDGPGIRNTVFMKGCPLRCAWCANPETQLAAAQLAYSRQKCLSCGHCVAVCPQQALRLGETGEVVIDRQKCASCFSCVQACPSQAMHSFGSKQTAEELYQQVKSGRSWRTSNGVTVSGGEPLMQADFVSALLRRCHSAGMHTAIETCGYAPWSELEKVAPHCDLVFFDVKLADAERHKQYTGQDNQLILENLRRLAAEYPDLSLNVRTPVIPGVNDTEADIYAIVDILRGLAHLDDYELLPFHSFGESKYIQLGMTYALAGAPFGDKEHIAQLNAKVRQELGLTR